LPQIADRLVDPANFLPLVGSFLLHQCQLTLHIHGICSKLFLFLFLIFDKVLVVGHMRSIFVLDESVVLFLDSDFVLPYLFDLALCLIHFIRGFSSASLLS
jgi:hypothetical protein